MEKNMKSALMLSDPDGDDLKIRMEILEESTDLKDGGDLESRPDRVASAITGIGDGRMTITAPENPGAYRIFLYVLDGNNHAATVNIPFFVE